MTRPRSCCGRDSVAARKPGRRHLLCRLVLATEGPVAAVAELQRALLHATPEARNQLFKITAIVAIELAKAGYFPAALKHFELAVGLDSSAESVLESALASFKSNPPSLPGSKTTSRSEQCPAGLETPLRSQFLQLLGWAQNGLWDPGRRRLRAAFRRSCRRPRGR